MHIITLTLQQKLPKKKTVYLVFLGTFLHLAEDDEIKVYLHYIIKFPTNFGA